MKTQKEDNIMKEKLCVAYSTFDRMMFTEIEQVKPIFEYIYIYIYCEFYELYTLI